MNSNNSNNSWPVAIGSQVLYMELWPLKKSINLENQSCKSSSKKLTDWANVWPRSKPLSASQFCVLTNFHYFRLGFRDMSLVARKMSLYNVLLYCDIFLATRLWRHLVTNAGESQSTSHGKLRGDVSCGELVTTVANVREGTGLAKYCTGLTKKLDPGCENCSWLFDAWQLVAITQQFQNMIFIYFTLQTAIFLWPHWNFSLAQLFWTSVFWAPIGKRGSTPSSY